MTKLYLGCARPPFHPQHLAVLGNPEEWVWVDKYIDHPQVKKWDAETLEEVEDGTVEAIYASHLLEHIPHTRVRHVLQLWNRKLKSGGTLILNVPDLIWACRQLIKLEGGTPLDGYYHTYQGDTGLLSIFYGTQSHSGEYHQGGFTKSTLGTHLSLSGFNFNFEKDIRQEMDAHDMGVLIAEATKL